MPILRQIRPGATFVELLLFVTLMAMMTTTVIPLLFNSTESRQRQDAIALVEQTGAQLLQTFTHEIRSAERVLDPALGSTGVILALQTSSGSTNPTIFARQTGAVIIVQGTGKDVLSTDLVGINSLLFDNTSVSESRQSVAVSFSVSRTIRLHQPLVYTGFFEAVVSVFPDDSIGASDSCGCDAPFCDTGSGIYIWYMCSNSVCQPYANFTCVFET